MPARARLLTLAAACALIPATGLAQTAPTPPPPPPASTPAPPSFFFRPENRIDLLISERWRDEGLRRRELRQKVLAGESPERVARAQRLATILNTQGCAPAHQTALSENDAALAQRIAQICRKR